ncbi:hypothetical protein D3C86_1948830 [compost metagenome]
MYQWQVTHCLIAGPFGPERRQCRAEPGNGAPRGLFNGFQATGVFLLREDAAGTAIAIVALYGREFDTRPDVQVGREIVQVSHDE